MSKYAELLAELDQNYSQECIDAAAAIRELQAELAAVRSATIEDCAKAVEEICFGSYDVHAAAIRALQSAPGADQCGNAKSERA